MATRTQVQHGATALKNVDRIHIKANPNIRELECRPWYTLCQRIILCCYAFSPKRSYNYVRENSIETNSSYENCCCCSLPDLCCMPYDFTNVSYFDMPPFVLWSCCYCNGGTPNFRVYEPGYMLCCIKCSHEAGCCCCSEKQAVITPCDSFCCCCTNYATDCGNCFGCCGPITGNPICYMPVWPNPDTDEDVEIYVASASKALNNYHGREALLKSKE